MSKINLLALIAVIIPSAAIAESSILPGFHLAESEIEVTADRIIHEAAHNINWQKRTENGSLPITTKLEEALFKAHNASLTRKCNGRDIAGENCGLSYNPLICGEDFADRYYYRVEAENPESVVIRSSAYEDGRDSTRYGLLNQNGWKIDSIRCSLGNFN